MMAVFIPRTNLGSSWDFGVQTVTNCVAPVANCAAACTGVAGPEERLSFFGSASAASGGRVFDQDSGSSPLSEQCHCRDVPSFVVASLESILTVRLGGLLHFYHYKDLAVI